MEPVFVPVTENDPTWGAPTAPVTAVVFSDFECSFCGRHAQTMAKLKAKYGDDLRLVFKQYPLQFHPNAETMAVVSLGALKLGKFWEVHDILFSGAAFGSDDDFAEALHKAGVNAGDLLQASLDPKCLEKVEADLALGNQVGINGTPATFINGILVSGAVPFDELDAVVRIAMARSLQVLRQGIPADKVYEKVSGH